MVTATASSGGAGDPTTGSGLGLGLALEDGRALPTSGAVTPPRPGPSGVSAATAFTPDRGLRLPAYELAEHTADGLADGSPWPSSRTRSGVLGHSAFSDAAHDSPSSIPSAVYLDESRPMITPAPRRQELRLAPPSTAHVPSMFMPASSPASFWKLADLGSTPGRAGPDLSPTKLGNGAVGDDEMAGDERSSPVPTIMGRIPMESPSKPGLNRATTTTTTTTTTTDAAAAAVAARRGAILDSSDDESDDDEEIIDLGM